MVGMGEEDVRPKEVVVHHDFYCRGNIFTIPNSQLKKG
jgi:hypothetical protein